MKRIFLLGFTFTFCFSLFSLPLVSSATTLVGQYHTSNGDLLNDLINNTQLYDSGYITYKRSDGFSYINNTLKYSVKDKYLSSAGGHGNFEYSYGLNYTILDHFLIVPNMEAARWLSGQELMAFRESNPLSQDVNLVKIDTGLGTNKDYIKSIIKGYGLSNESSAFTTFKKMIPLVNFKYKVNVKNYGKDKQYFLVSYSDRKVLYTIKDNRVVSVRERDTRGLTSYLSMREAKISTLLPASYEIK